MKQPIFKIWFGQTSTSAQIWQLAWPMILANISVPLLGFVDTAVIGHLPEAGYLAGTALGSLIVTVVFWLLGFLRMSTTGLIAQSSTSFEQQKQVVLQGLTWVLLLSTLILSFQTQLFELVSQLVQSSEMELTKASAQAYFDIRIWITPFALANLVLSGYLIGQGNTKLVLRAVISANIVNLIADLIFVPVLGWQVAGVAYASVLAELLMFAIYFGSVFGAIGYRSLLEWRPFNIEKAMLKLNSSLFARSFLLQLCLSFMTLYAVKYGAIAVAANAIIMQFFLFISFALDGIAFALESMVGKAYGKKQVNKMRHVVATGLILASGLALAYSLIYLLLNQPIIALLSSIEEIKLLLKEYQLWIVLFPLVSFLSFIMDGVFVGLAWSKKMLSSMFAAAFVFFAAFSLTTDMANQGLWLAFCLFMFTRGSVQLWQYKTSTSVSKKENRTGY